VIIGPGAMGSLFAAHLLRAGHVVSLLGRAPSGDTSLPANIRVELRDGSVTELRHIVTTDPAVVATADVIIVLVKVADTPEALASIKPYVLPDQLILTLQNGLGAAERVHDVLGDVPRIVVGVTSQAAYRPDHCSVFHTGEGPTIIGPTNPDDFPAVVELSEIMTQAGLPAAAVRDVERWIWQKVAVNAAINGLTALAGVPNGAIIEESGLLDAAEIIAEEVAAVARARGIELGSVLRTIAETAAATSANRSSMLQDMDAGRKTEVEALHGAIVAAGQAAGIATPANQVLAALIRLHERPSA
jgi:2-dehydropantoate 2-reductase